MDERKRGTVEMYPEVYEPLKQLGVPASVWDEVLQEIFNEPFGKLATPFQELLFELEMGKADYPRPDGINDHDYVRSILTRAVAAFEAKGTDHARLMRDDSWNYETRSACEPSQQKKRSIDKSLNVWPLPKTQRQTKDCRGISTWQR